MYGVVKNHGGDIRVDSLIGEGTTFTLLFPASSNKVRKSQPQADQEIIAETAAGGTVLIVDDEPAILKFCGEMIESLGFKVLSASGGQEAVNLYQEHYNHIDLVILDMVMPVMDGWGVYQALKIINPHVKIIIASGYILDERAERIISEGPHRKLKKPYTRSELARTIAEVTASSDLLYTSDSVTN